MIITDKLEKVDKNRKTIPVEFTAKNLTPFGGLGLFSQFVSKLKVEKKLNHIHPSQIETPNPGKYSVGEKIVDLMYGMICDLERPADMEILQKDEIVQTIIDHEGYPDQTTFSRFLGSFYVKGAQEIEDIDIQTLLQVRQNFSDYWKLTLDIDSHVKTVYGNQQRANVGYNPKKPGRKSYHPLFCFIGETRDILMGKFRAGNKYTSAGVIPFLKECLGVIPAHILQVYVRGDSGFYSFDNLYFLEKETIKYAIVAKLYKTIQNKLGGLNYRKIGGGVEVSEYKECQRQGKKELSCRMVVIREEIKEDQKAKKEPKLFELKGYSYQVIVTNIRRDSPENVWRFYNGRANIENMIKEAALSFGLEVSPSHQYAGNMAYFLIGLLAYNLVNWFKEKVLNQTQQKKMLKWIRNHYFLIAGRLVHSGGRVILKLSQNYPWQEDYRKAEARLEVLQFI
jgi:hypothetical protein